MENLKKTESDSIFDEQLKKEDIERYCRQIILPEFNLSGQERLKNAKVLIVGAGGLGSPCLMYLSGAGVGEIGIIDGDLVDNSNLHRQIIHNASSKGINKAKSAAGQISSFNPLIKINAYEEHFTNKNALKIAENYDLLIDCTDNPATRYLINDTCVVLKKPLVSGSAVKWEGQLTVYHRDALERFSTSFKKLPCYRCLFPVPSPTSSVCNCADAGVFGPVPGVIGVMQSNEAVKVILGLSDKILAQRMLTYDALEMAFKLFKLRNAKADCAVCGENPTITKDTIQDFDYNNFVNPIACRLPLRVEIPQENNIEWKAFFEMVRESESNQQKVLLLDVRPEEQYNLVSLNNKFNFISCPLQGLRNNFESYEQNLLIQNKNNKIFIMCKAGNASTHATKLLLEKGYLNTFNIVNGLAAYRKDIDDNIATY